MIFIHARSPSHIYALQHIHNFCGNYSSENLHFVAGEYVEGISKYEPCVFFSVSDTNGCLPDRLEFDFCGKSLQVRTKLVWLILNQLGRAEEKRAGRDNFSRMPLCQSYAFQKGIHTLSYLDRILEEFKGVLFDFLDHYDYFWKKMLPSGEPLLCLTHDIDSIKGKSLVRYVFWLWQAIRRRETLFFWGEIFQQVVSNVRLAADPHFSFWKYRKLEDTYGFRSTFFAMSLPFFLGLEGRRYALRNRNLLRTLKSMYNEGWEVGLHPSRATHLSREKLLKEIGRFRRLLKVNAMPGIRNHYLKAEFPQTWRLAEELGIPYDATLGWAEEPGFRAGTSRPYQPFDVGLGRKLDIWEIPLIVMDVSLKGDSDAIVAECTRLAEECFRFGSPFTLLWHTDALSELDYPELAKAYPRLLQIFSDMGCRGVTASELVRIYREYEENLSEHRTIVDCRPDRGRCR